MMECPSLLKNKRRNNKADSKETGDETPNTGSPILEMGVESKGEKDGETNENADNSISDLEMPTLHFL